MDCLDIGIHVKILFARSLEQIPMQRIHVLAFFLLMEWVIVLMELGFS